MEKKYQDIKRLFVEERLNEAFNIISTLETSPIVQSEYPEIDIIKKDIELANECLELLADLDS